MGADGGIVLCTLRSEGAEQEVRRLLQPFYRVIDPKQADFQEEACDEWFRNNTVPSNCMVGYYGTHLDFSLDDLREILHPDERLVADPTLTFDELCLDIETRPFMTANDGVIHYVKESGFVRAPPRWGAFGVDGERAFTLLDLWVIDMVMWRLPEPGCLDPIADMRVGDWADRLRQLVKYDSIWLEETWT